MSVGVGLGLGGVARGGTGTGIHGHTEAQAFRIRRQANDRNAGTVAWGCWCCVAGVRGAFVGLLGLGLNGLGLGNCELELETAVYIIASTVV